MASVSGLFTFPEFIGRNVLRLAPDCFVTLNTELGARFISPLDTDSSNSEYKRLEVRAGVTSININSAIQPAGANRANIEITAPMYKGLHEDFYMTFPNGTRRVIFSPMNEIKIYMKGLYLKDGNPTYYPVFWGFVTGVSESYSGGVFTISLNCSDLLSWWNYQKISLIPQVTSLRGASPKPLSTVFENMNPWQIIYNLFVQTGWADEKGNKYNFIYPKLSKINTSPDWGSLFKNKDAIETFLGGLADKSIEYWQYRLGFNLDAQEGERLPLEMFGLLSQVDLTNKSVISALSFDSSRKRVYRNKLLTPEVSDPEKSGSSTNLLLNFGLLAEVQPYGAFNIYNGGSEPLEHSKIEIVNEVCAQTDMEFFMDTNGSVVFKPPFYNLDVTTSTYPTYTIEAKDIINFNSDINSDAIRTFLEVYNPRYQSVPEIDNVAHHIDFDLLARFGMRYEKMDIRYGNDASKLRLIAAAKLAKINGKAYTGSVSIPLRPEIRMGYPLYIKHVDAYFYVTGVNHSFSFGSSATTTLSLEFRRDRVFSDGTIELNGTEIKAGEVLTGCVFRYNAPELSPKDNPENRDPNNMLDEVLTPSQIEDKEALENDGSTAVGVSGKSILENEEEKRKELLQNSVISGPRFNGLYKIDKANIEVPGQYNNNGAAVVRNNELIMMSFPNSKNNYGPTGQTTEQTGDNRESIPYTDLKGYRHIGGFPYGANLSFVDSDTRLSPGGTPASEAESAAKKTSEASGDAATNTTTNRSYSYKESSDTDLGVNDGTAGSDYEATAKFTYSPIDLMTGSVKGQGPKLPASSDASLPSIDDQTNAMTNAGV